MKAIHGGKAKHDKIASQKIAALLRGGLRPQASVYPAQMRATRDLLRRRTHLMRKRAARLSHVQKTTSQYNLSEIGKNIAYKANRTGVAERFADPAVQKTIAVDLSLITYDDALLQDLERSLLNTAKHHDAQTLSLLQTVPGLGKILSLVLRYAIHRIDRFPSVQDFASYGRLVKCRKASGGKRLGTSGKKIGNAHLKGAFSEAATLFLRHNPQGQKLLARLAKKHDQGKALRPLAHKLGRAIYFMLKRKVAFDLEVPPDLREQIGRARRLTGQQRDEPQARTLHVRLTASVNAKVCLGHLSLSPGDCLDTRSGSFIGGGGSHPVACAAPPLSPALTGEALTLSQAY
jgi:transposase